MPIIESGRWLGKKDEYEMPNRAKIIVVEGKEL